MSTRIGNALASYAGQAKRFSPQASAESVVDLASRDNLPGHQSLELTLAVYALAVWIRFPEYEPLMDSFLTKGHLAIAVREAAAKNKSQPPRELWKTFTDVLIKPEFQDGLYGSPAAVLDAMPNWFLDYERDASDPSLNRRLAIVEIMVWQRLGQKQPIKIGELKNLVRQNNFGIDALRPARSGPQDKVIGFASATFDSLSSSRSRTLLLQYCLWDSLLRPANGRGIHRLYASWLCKQGFIPLPDAPLKEEWEDDEEEGDAQRNDERKRSRLPDTQYDDCKVPKSLFSALLKSNATTLAIAMRRGLLKYQLLAEEFQSHPSQPNLELDGRTQGALGKWWSTIKLDLQKVRKDDSDLRIVKHELARYTDVHWKALPIQSCFEDRITPKPAAKIRARPRLR